MDIINAIKRAKASKRVLFTTPTHSMGSVLPTVIKNLLGLNVFKSDFSEIDMLDNVRKPEKSILYSQQKAAEIYGTKTTFYLFNGSTSGILASMLSVLRENDKVIVARNCHESVCNGLVLTGAKPIWIMPEYDNDFDVFKEVKTEKIEQIIKQYSDVKAVIITSPTYCGVCSDIKRISEVCHKNNIVLIVDEAHGALLPFSDRLPDSAITLGADICVQSLHKNTPTLTQCAILHIGKNSLISPDIIQENLNLINTTSPSFVFLASIEATINYLNSNKGRNEINQLIDNIENLKNNFTKIKFLTSKNFDLTKLVFKKDGFSGEMLSDFLDKNNVEDELTTQNSVLCLTGIGTTKKKLKKLEKILEKLFAKKSDFYQNKSYVISLPKQKITPKQAHFAEKKLVKVKDAVGMIVAQNITPYPPCIPVLIKGEIFEQEHLKYFKNPDKETILTVV